MGAANLRHGRCYPRYAQVFPNRNNLLHLSWDISCMQAFFREEFCILLLPAHPGAPSRGVLIGERVRRLRMVSQAISGSLGVLPGPTTRARHNWQMAPGRTQAEARGIRRPEKAGPGVGGAVPAAKIAAVERREASVSRGRLRKPA